MGLQAIAKLGMTKGFKYVGRAASRLNGKQVVETMFRNAEGIEMKVVKDATTGKAISKTIANAEGSFTKTFLENGNGQVSWNELFKTHDGTILKDIDRQSILHEGKWVKKDGKFVRNWSATEVYNTKKDALLDKLGQLVGYDSRYTSRPYENLEPGNANIREMILNTTGTRVDNARGITLAGKLPQYKPGALYAGDEIRPATKLPKKFATQTQLEEFTGKLHLWSTLF